MTIELNGRRVELSEGSSVAMAVERASGDDPPAGIAVAVDGEVVPRSQWSETTLAQGQRVEVVTAVQGG